MRLEHGALLFSPKDLLAFLGCEHCAALDLARAHGQIPLADDPAGPYLDLLKQKGTEHEQRYLATLRAEGKTIRDLKSDRPLAERVEATRRAMSEGVDVVYQGALRDGAWHGYSDFLLRTDKPSKLGPWSYEVADTKLARSAKPKHVVQLCIYSELVAHVQGLMPDNAHVQLGDGTTFTLRLQDYIYYVASARDRFVAFIKAAGKTESEPCASCEMCNWSERCSAEWEASENLRLVARLTGPQANKLRAAGITSMSELGSYSGPHIPRIQTETFERLQSQARLQLVQRRTGAHEVDLLPPEPGRGFARLPRPNDGDLFFDMEGDPVYSPDGSLEYLFGFHHVDNGVEKFTPFWALDRASEKKAFEDALDFITERLRRFPSAFVYHYAAYEQTALRRLAKQYGAAPRVPAAAAVSASSLEALSPVEALKRLAQAYGTRENEVDDLLRARKFVDLYKVAREALRTSEPGYSIKDLEVFFAPARDQAIKGGGESVVAFERWIATDDRALLEQIEEYNKFDCVSTRLCRNWLLGNCRHPSEPATDSKLPEVEWFDPAREARDQAAREAELEAKRRTHDLEIVALRNLLARDVSDDNKPWRELLGYLLEYHRREARREWWDYFRRTDRLPAHQLIDDPECIGGLTVDPTVPARVEKQSRVFTLRFPDQETKLGVGKAVRADTEEELEIVSIDTRACTLELKVGPSRKPLAGVISLILQKPWSDNTIRGAIERYANAIVAGDAERFGATTSILRRDQPRIAGVNSGQSLLPAGQDDTRSIIDVISRMDRTHLVIQGPPGSGKTYTSAHAIVALMQEGKRVGVASNTHKAIHNLLTAVEEVAREKRFAFRGVKKSTASDSDSAYTGQFVESKPKTADVVAGRYDLLAGTAWLFADPTLSEELDYLFIDEAGQVCLANVVAMGPSAQNIVLVGDQMQLSQPVKGAHPGESGASGLEYLMQDHATVPPDRGVFLAHTRRMHPELCRFVSDVFYESRLEAHTCTFGQRLIVSEPAAVPPYGITFFAVDHDENGQKSMEEAKRLDAIYRELLGKEWIDQHGKPRTIGTPDILVVSPYNMQVSVLSTLLPDGARVGTVDKFQGQEGAAVLISLATSSAEYAPRGLEFLLMPNRLNVAISRGRCLAAIVASPRLLESDCRKVDDMARLNVLGRMLKTSAP